MVKEKNLSLTSITMIGIITALTCVLAPLSVPIGPVPISLSNFTLFLSVYVLGTKRSVIGCSVYLLLGLFGLPVFTGYGSGIGKVLGPTGGYMIGFFPLIIISGFFVKKYTDKWYISLIGMFIGSLICNTIGTIWLAFQANMSFAAAFLAGVIPFIPGDLIKMGIAIYIGGQLRNQLQRANILEN